MPPQSNADERRGAYRQGVAIVPKVAHILYGGVARRKLRLGVTDLSASGVNVRSRDELRSGDLLELAFDVDGDMQLQARVRRVARGDKVWDAGCAFEGLTERQADRIVKFIFTQQRFTLRARRNNA
jgi:hypothetical protein